MPDTNNIKITRTTNPKDKPSASNLGFGTYFTDHMFIMDYTEGKGWHDPVIVPYGPLEFDPSCMVFHYGQAIFEGLKAYKADDGRVLLFRPKKNMERINLSNDRVCIPLIDVDFAVKATKALVDIDRDWIPAEKETSLYIRPFIIATDPYLGVCPSHTYKFMIILSPSGSYYKEGINPVNIYVEEKYVRAAKGGVGAAKVPGNYAASLKSQMEAKEKGFTQVLWLDGVERKYIEEVGTMNIFFVIDGEIVTPELNDSILPGITRLSTIELLRDKGYKVTERKLSIEEVFDAHAAGTLSEAFGTGTAAVISPVGGLTWGGQSIVINNNETGPISKTIYDTITGIQSGNIEDKYNWIEEVQNEK